MAGLLSFALRAATGWKGSRLYRPRPAAAVGSRNDAELFCETAEARRLQNAMENILDGLPIFDSFISREEGSVRKEVVSYLPLECPAFGSMFKKLKSAFYYCWEPLPKPLRDGICGLLKLTVFIFLLTIAALFISYKYPDRSVELSWGDFKVSSSAARQSAKEAEESEKKAKEALARIESVEKTVNAQRATIDASFSLASDAKAISGIATQTLAEAKQSLERMKSDADFVDTVIRALSGYADAYDALTAIVGGRPDDPRYAKAYNTVEFVRDYHALWNYAMRKPPNFPARYGNDPASLNLQQLTEAFQGMALNEQLEAVSFVHERSLLPASDKLEFLYARSIFDPNLRVRSSAGAFYMDLAGMKDINNPLQPSLIRLHHLTNSLSPSVLTNSPTAK